MIIHFEQRETLPGSNLSLALKAPAKPNTSSTTSKKQLKPAKVA
jgi:hypothetical protein